MADHNELGKKGEELANQHLRNTGFSILHRNWRFKKDEVDIIAMDGNELVFVEVKTRSTSYFGEPEEAVDDRKQRLMIRAAEEYINKYDIGADIRFDIVSVIVEGNKNTIRHIREAFYPELEE